MQKYKVFISDTHNYPQRLEEAIDLLGLEKTIRQAEGVFLKPNLTYPIFRPGVTTTKEMLHAALQVFTEITPRVIVGESDGAYGSYDIQQAFEAFDLYNLTARYGAKVINLSQVPAAACTFNTQRGPVVLKLPKFLIEENYLFITIPVPKMHCITGVSLSFKNQWGCIPDIMRLRNHYYFDDIIGPINRLLNVGLTIVDGTYGLNKNGPMIEGEAVQLGWMIVSQNLRAADRVVSHLMGLRLEDYSHYRSIQQEAPLPLLSEIEINQDLSDFLARTPKFYLKRNFWNYLSMTTWYSQYWCHLVYESSLSEALHKIMYTFRTKPKEIKDYKPSK